MLRIRLAPGDNSFTLIKKSFKLEDSKAQQTECKCL